MDNNEIITNEEVMEMTSEIATGGYGNGFMVVAGVVGVVFVGGLAYKYIAKPIVAKIRTKKNQQETNEEFNDFEGNNDESDCVIN